jgi:uncharacterized protein (DUF58 family)
MSEQVQRDFLNAGVLSRLAAVPLHARFPMVGNVSGRHRSPVRGSSLEFSTYRKYVPGDDTRRLDWRAYGRSDRHYIKQFETDTNLRLCLVLDTSGSMAFAGRDGTKLDYARHLAGTLAYLAAGQGDAVGLCCSGESLARFIPSRRNPAHLRHVFDQLDQVEAKGQTGLEQALHEVAERVAPRALIVILSDLFVDPAPLGSCFQHFRFRKHDVAVFHLLGQAELEFQFDRPVRFLDLEGGASILADPSIIARQYHEAFQRYFEQLTQAVHDAQIDYHRVEIDEPYDDVLARFLLARMPKGAK